MGQSGKAPMRREHLNRGWIWEHPGWRWETGRPVGHKGRFGGGVSIVWQLRAYLLLSILLGFNTS